MRVPSGLCEQENEETLAETLFLSSFANLSPFLVLPPNRIEKVSEVMSRKVSRSKGKKE